jgi:hypothetical protein
MSYKCDESRLGDGFVRAKALVEETKVGVVLAKNSLDGRSGLFEGANLRLDALERRLVRDNVEEVAIKSGFMREVVRLIRDKPGFMPVHARIVSIKPRVVRDKPCVARHNARFVRNNRSEDEHYLAAERHNTFPDGNIVLHGSKRGGHDRFVSRPVALLVGAGSQCLLLGGERTAFFRVKGSR